MPNNNFLNKNIGYKPLIDNEKESKLRIARGVTPEEGASLWSKCTFSWFTPLMNDACDHILGLDEYYKMPKTDNPDFMLSEFEKNWKEEIYRMSNKYESHKLSCECDSNTIKYTNNSSNKLFRKKLNPSLVRILFNCFKKQFFIVMVLVLFSNILSMTQVVLLRMLLMCIKSADKVIPDVPVDKETIPWWASLLGIIPGRFNWGIATTGFMYVIAMTLVNIMYPILRQQETRLVSRIGRRIRSLITGVIYRKLLRMDSNMFREDSNISDLNNNRLSIASIVSLESAKKSCGLSGGVVNLLSNDVSRFSKLYTSHEFYSGIVSLVIATILLYFVIGISGLAGMMIMLIHVIWSVASLNYRAYERRPFSEIRDHRILLTSEYISCVKIIKSYSWEDCFIKEIDKYRKKELRSLLLQGIYWGLSTACHSVVMHSVLMTIVLRKYTGAVVDPANIFFAFVLYDAVSEVLVSFPKSYALFRDLLLSCERISEFLMLEERIDDNTQDNFQYLKKTFNKNEYELPEGVVSYEKVELRWPDGALLLKDLNFNVESGEIMSVIGPVGSGKSGLLLSIIKEILPSKGNFGIKGKLAYVSQLVWIYTGTIRENILFGSPYDPAWYETVISACSLTMDFQSFPDGDQTIIGGKTNNLSGGQKQRISLARAVYQNAQIYVLDDCLSAVDSNVSAQIFKSCIMGLLRSKCIIMATHKIDIIPFVDKVILLDEIKKCPIYTGNPKGLEKQPLYSKIFEDLDIENNGLNKESSFIESFESIPERNNVDSFDSIESVVVNDEKKTDIEEEGVITFDTYKRYIMSYGTPHLIFAFIFSLIAVLINVLGTFYTGYWAEHFYELDWRTYFTIYLAISVIFPIVCVTTTILFRYGGLRVSRLFHGKLLSHIRCAPLIFFERTPIGRILNRFTSDLVHIDELLPTSFNNATITVLTSIIMLISISFVTPQFIICIPIILYCFYCVTKKYPPILRQSERKSADLSTPITSHIVETMTGLTTIHTFGMENMLIKKMDDSMIALNRVRYHLDIAYCWLYLRLEVIGCITLFVSGIFGVLLSACNREYCGIIGTTLSFAVAMPGWLRYCIFLLGEFEADMVGFERIRTYADSELIEITSVKNQEVPKNWPSEGKVEFKNVDMIFQPNSTPILNNINFTILPGEKIGIVGRTGAGKSSLFTALLRLFEPTNGSIFIDNIDTSTISTYELRSRISIVPQDPVIFTGTIRFNLDPKGQFTDEELYKVLKRTHIYDYIKNIPNGLDYLLLSGGNTLSVGLKQLLCLARAILRKSKILLLDEATSFVDVQTDSLIQETIRNEFKESTTITIAHRIKTIINYDRIMVLDSGKIIEFDSPKNLLNNPKSSFNAFVLGSV